MEQLYNIVMELIESIPWFVTAYGIYTFGKIKPKKSKLQYRDFLMECTR